MQRPDLALAHSEEGFTLIEVVITVALISIAFVGILSAVGGLVMSGVQNKNATTVQAAVRNVAAYVQSYSSVAYIPCSGTPQATYNTAVASAPVPAGLTPQVVSVKFWNGDTPASFATGACPGAGDQGLEQVTVQVSTGSALGGAFTRSLTVLKRSTP